MLDFLYSGYDAEGTEHSGSASFAEVVMERMTVFDCLECCRKDRKKNHHCPEGDDLCHGEVHYDWCARCQALILKSLKGEMVLGFNRPRLVVPKKEI